MLLIEKIKMGTVSVFEKRKVAGFVIKKERFTKWTSPLFCSFYCPLIKKKACPLF